MSMTYQNEKYSQQPARLVFIIRTLVLLILWWGLAGDDPNSWWLGVPASLVGAFISVKILPPVFSPRWRVVPRFLVYFLKHTVGGSLDVARRALHPDLPIDPATFHYPVRLPDGPPRLFFVTVVGLLPGTLCIAREGPGLFIHAVDCGMDVETELQRFEVLVAQMFGVEECSE